MTKLSKSDAAILESHVSDLREKRNALCDAIAGFNRQMEAEWEALSPVLESFNESLKAAREWKENIISQIEEYMGSKSEKWHESEKAGNVENWRSEFEVLDLDELEIEQPEKIDSDIRDYAEDLEGLPAAAETE